MADANAPPIDLSENKGPAILAAMWPLTIVTTVIVAARMYIRSQVVRNMGLDDWLILASMVSLE
jgi:hypothetical protein